MAQAKSLLCGVQPGQKVLILGSGFFAVEAASVSADAGADVTILDEAPWLLHRQIDRAAGLLLEKTLESNGIKVLLKASPAAVLGSDHAEGLLLTDGSRIDAEHIICAGERRPNTTLAQKAGLSVNQGIIVDDGLTTSNPDIYALGDCTEHCGIADGLIETAYAQAEVLARRLTFEPEAAFKGPLRCTNLKVAGIPIFSAGDFIGREECLVWSDTAGGNYKKLVITEGKLSGVMLYGDTSEWHTYLELIRSQTIISPLWNGIALACFGKAKNLAV
jgi:nitrite reductase (NADH) large subunit